MLKHILLVIYRNIKRFKSYSFINIFGLALGMAVSILILLYIQDELSYDRYHDNSDRIYRVSREWINQDGKTNLHLGHTAPPFAPLLEEDFEPVKEAVRFLQISPLVKYEGKTFVENRFFFADADLFKVFSWEMLQGDPATALTYPDGVVLTRSTAKKYFGDTDPMGKPIDVEIDGMPLQFQVKGVMEDIPENSHFQFDFLASMEPVVQFYGGQEQFMSSFGSNNFATYLLLPEDYNPDLLQAQLPNFIDKHMAPNQDGSPASTSTQLNLWPLTDIHLYSQLDSEVEANGNIEYVYIYTAIAIFILLIACINFMNLSTARSARRAIEVGLRKVIGADRRSLINQFVGESVFLSFIAMMVAIILAELSLPYFNSFIGKELSLNLLENYTHLIGLLGIIAFVGLIAGSYPAFFLSGFQPSKVLKGTFKIAGAHQKFRSVLVVSQFTISVALIASMGIVYNQLEFMQNKDLGFDKENIAVLPVSNQIVSNFTEYRQQLLQHSGIINVAEASRVPSGRLLDAQGTTAEVNGELQTINTRVADIHVSHNYLETFGISLIAGRDFDYNLASDSTEAFILNESAVKAIGWESPEQALDKQFHYGGRRGHIIGVVRDFNFESLHQNIAPIVFLIPDTRIRNVAVKFKDTHRAEVLSFLEEKWTFWRPDYPFTYYFIEDNFEEQYASEQRLGQIFGAFAILAIIIASLGLFGLASFTAQQRIKEIGIRKTLGATISQIVVLISKRFTLLVLLSITLAIPIAWYAMDQWLGGFAYRIDVPLITFIWAGTAALAIAWITVSYQSIKAAMVNPVDSLRSE
ncbi:MAG: FtsX-like permease family protein [Balneolaceae bacterium]|nr:FtsX-like permease family protein [Balneolaceae bacterium]